MSEYSAKPDNELFTNIIRGKCTPGEGKTPLGGGLEFIHSSL